ncbi:MAG: hypothetical protein GX752_00090 [Clostridium sp.]|nr:hypothetical protein [Clostridium sp.]
MFEIKSTEKYAKYLNIYFYITGAFTLYTMLRIFMSRRGLPEGACPVENYNLELKIAIGMSIIYFVLSFFIKEDKSKKVKQDS